MHTQSDEPTQRGQGELPKRPLAPNVTWREPMESGEFDKGSINAIARGASDILDSCRDDIVRRFLGLASRIIAVLLRNTVQLNSSA